MKISTIILIFSGLTGLNRCSTDVKFDFPFFKTEQNIETHKTLHEKDSFNLVKTNSSDSSTSSLFIHNANTEKWNENKDRLIYSGNII